MRVGGCSSSMEAGELRLQNEIRIHVCEAWSRPTQLTSSANPANPANSATVAAAFPAAIASIRAATATATTGAATSTVAAMPTISTYLSTTAAISTIPATFAAATTTDPATTVAAASFVLHFYNWAVRSQRQLCVLLQLCRQGPALGRQRAEMGRYNWQHVHRKPRHQLRGVQQMRQPVPVEVRQQRGVHRYLCATSVAGRAPV